MRSQAIGIDPDPSLAIGRMILQQGKLDVLTLILPVALHKRLITLVDHPFANLFMEFDQRTPFFCQNENTGSFLVQPVHQFQESGIGSCGTQLLDDPVRNTGTTMNGYTCRFVDDQNTVIFIQDVEAGCRVRVFLPVQRP